MIKAAIHYGLDKYPSGNRLYKCVRDARLMNSIFGGKMILDKAGTPKGIVDSFRQVVRSAVAGDQIVVSYSGHGTQVKDRDGDEPDKLDEALVAINLQSVTDDVIFSIMSELHPQARGWLIADSCFSGTIHRAAPMIASANVNKLRKRRIRYIPGAMVKGSTKVANLGPQAPLSNWTISSGCADFEFSFEGDDNGILSGAIGKFYDPKISYAKLHELIAKEVKKSGYDQHPQLTCTAAARRWKLPSR